MGSKHHNTWLGVFTVITVLCTLALMSMGALVTSKDVGMAVIDWPTSFQRHMFLLPPNEWVGKFGIFEEHAHRLIASLVGLLTAILAAWLWIREATGRPRLIALSGIVIMVVSMGIMMGIRKPYLFYAVGMFSAILAAFSVWKLISQPYALRWWGMLAFGMVIVQGVLGGGRVAEIKPEYGIIHGTLAQIFLVVLTILALFNSRWWKQTRTAVNEDERTPRIVRTHFFYASILIFLQLIVGATMRHQHAGLPVWDFPAAHGQVWPKTTDAHIAAYNQDRNSLHARLKTEGLAIDEKGLPIIYLNAIPDITAKHVNLHMTHRVMAGVILLVVIGTAIVTSRRLGLSHPLSRLSQFWTGLILLQATLGVLTVLKYKPADITSLHVLVGALALLTGVMGSIISRFKHLPQRNLETSSVTKMKEVTA